jgi:hypothetical protein
MAELKNELLKAYHELVAYSPKIEADFHEEITGGRLLEESFC